MHPEREKDRTRRDALFTVTVAVGGREPRTYTVIAPQRNDGFEGMARTHAMEEYRRDPETAPLSGEFVDYEVELATD